MNENYVDEINSLNDYYIKQLQNQDDQMGTMQQEISRLNNIIDELEKWLEEYKIQCKKYDSNSTICVINCILDKLKELKEGK